MVIIEERRASGMSICKVYIYTMNSIYKPKKNSKQRVSSVEIFPFFIQDANISNRRSVYWSIVTRLYKKKRILIELLFQGGCSSCKSDYSQYLSQLQLYCTIGILRCFNHNSSFWEPIFKFFFCFVTYSMPVQTYKF